MKTAAEWNWEHTKICHNDPAVSGQLLPTPQMINFLKQVQADALRHAAMLVIGNATDNGLATIRVLERAADQLDDREGARLPTIHTNGTSAQDLRDGYLAAWRAVQEAKNALRKIEFNARDYYVAGPDAWDQAAREQRARLAALDAIAEELLTITNHCQTAIDDKEARRRERETV